MKKLLLILLLLIPTSSFASIADIYLSQSSTGTTAGTSCANSKAISFFNTSGNWGTGAAQIGVTTNDTTVHLCGTITTKIVFQAAGTSGHYIKLLFETNAKFSAATWTSGNVITGDSASHIDIDGGSNGIIEATNNGSSPTYANHDSFGGIHLSGVTDVKIHNLTIQNIYVKNVNDANAGGNSIYLVGGVSSSHFYSNTFTNAGFNFDWTLSNGDSHNEINNNTMSLTSKNIVLGASSDITSDDWKIHDNDFSSWINWDDNSGANSYHHAGIHFFANNGTGATTITNVQIYNNYFHGDEGSKMTAPIYFEGNSGTFTSPQLFNNVYQLTNSGQVFDGDIYLKGSVTNTGYYNNLHLGNIGGNCVQLQGPTGMISKNNIFETCLVVYEYSGTPIVTADHNDYFNNTAFGPSSGANTTLAAWKTVTGLAETASITTDPALISLIPTASSPVWHTGVNLTSLSITALDTSKNLIARDPSTAWTIGPNDATATNTYYVGVSGSDANSCTTAKSSIAGNRKLTIAGGLGCLAAGDDSLIIGNGTYQGASNMLKPATNLSGTAGHYITVSAENDGQVVIDGQDARVPIVWDHNSYWIAQGMDAHNSSDDVVEIFPGSDYNIFRRICAYNANPSKNVLVWSVWQATGNLLEDTCAFGTGRKMYASFELSGLTIRRPWAMWNKVLADFGPFITYSLSYDSDHVIIENPIGTRNEDADSYSMGATDQGIFSMDRLEEYNDCEIHSGFYGGLAYLLGSQNIIQTDNHAAEIHGGQVFGSLQFKDVLLYIEQGTHGTLRRVQMAGFDNTFTGGCPSNSPTATRNLTNVSIIGNSAGGGASDNLIDLSSPNNGWAETNYHEADTIAALYAAESPYVNSGNKGATLCYQYQNGTLTSTPLWPWPMNSRISAALIRDGRASIDVTNVAENIMGTIPAVCGGNSPPTSGPQESFASYTPTTDLDTLNGGDGFVGAWTKSADNPVTVQTAPAGLNGKAAKSSNAGSGIGGYFRQYSPMAAGFTDVILQNSVTNNNDTLMFELGDLTSRRTRVGFTNDGFLSIYDGTGLAFTHLNATVANTNYQVHIEYDNVNHPNQYRAQVNHGSFTSWVGTIGSYSTLSTVGINDHATNTHNFWLSYINGQSYLLAPGTITGHQNTSVAIPLTAVGSSWVNGTTACSFGDTNGLTVVSTVVLSATTATCNITLSPTATINTRDLYMTTTNETEVYVNAFSVIALITPPSGATGKLRGFRGR